MSELDTDRTARGQAPTPAEPVAKAAAGNDVSGEEAGGDGDGTDESKDRASTEPAKTGDATPPDIAGAANPSPGPAADGTEAPAPAEAPAAADASAPNVAPGQPAQSASEVELKLLVDPARLADFNGAPAIATRARNKGSRKHLKSVYYDTPERLLQENGLSLRVRQSGQRFVQTVKAELGEDALRRGEWEASLTSLVPDIELAMPFVPAKLRDELRVQPLQPVFTADIRRLQRLVDLPAGTVEVAFDRGVLKASDRALPVSEIELELKEGSASAIYELALALAEHGAVRPSTRSKAARGFDLASDAPPAAKKTRKLDVDPFRPLEEAFAAILGACLSDLLVSMPAAEDGRDPEGVHQVRVALRRLRSALDSLRAVTPSDTLEALREDAKWLAARMSAARSWDIFRGETLPAVAGSCPTIAGFDVLGEATEERRRKAYDDARSALADSRSTRFVLRLGAWIEARGWRENASPEALPLLAEPAFSFARRILSAHHAKVLKRGRHFKSLTPEKRHRLRLAVKKLRYVSDFLLPLCTDPKSAKRYTTSLAGLQDELGAFNDMATTGSLLGNLVATSKGGDTAAAAIAGWQAHAMVGAEARLRHAWKEFAKTRPPWSTPTLG